MYHIALRGGSDAPQKINYANLKPEEEKPETIEVPNDNSVPKAPDGFVFYRIQSGDTLVSLSVRFSVSQNKIRRYNNKVCFGHRLSHIVGKLLLIPVEKTANLTNEMREQLKEIYILDENETKKAEDENIDERKYEPDENGKYQLRKALMFHTRGLDEHRANFYLGEANWNVRKALNIWKGDDKWEKQNAVMAACKLSQEEAIKLLETYNYDESEAIRFWHHQHKKLNKKSTPKQTDNDDGNEGGRTTVGGDTELTAVKKGDDKSQGLIDDADINYKQGPITSRFCCG